MRFSALRSPTWIIPSMPSPSSTNAPNLVRLVTGPSTIVPAGNFFSISAQGSPSACFSPSETRRSLTPSTTTSTASPGLTTSEGLRAFLVQDISERWISPSRPGSSSTNAPKSVTRVTTPRARSPVLYVLAGFGPRIGRELLHAERNPALDRIDLQNLNVDLLADSQHIGGLVHAALGDVGHMQ